MADEWQFFQWSGWYQELRRADGFGGVRFDKSASLLLAYGWKAGVHRYRLWHFKDRALYKD